MSLLFCRFFPHMSLPVLLDTKYLLLSYTIWEYAVITVLWCTTELMFPFICRSVPVVGLVPLGYKYRALGCRTYLYTSTSLVSGRRYNMIVGCFYMSISMIGSEYCLMCPDSRRGRLHGRLAMLRGLPHPPAQPQCLFWLLPFSHQISPPPLSHQHLHFGFSLSGVPYFKVHASARLQRCGAAMLVEFFVSWCGLCNQLVPGRD